MIRNSSRIIRSSSVDLISSPFYPMPERGIGYFDNKELENYYSGVSQTNTSSSYTGVSITNSHLNNLDMGQIQLIGLSVERAGNLLNSARKSNDKWTIGQHTLITLNGVGVGVDVSFRINNRRAIIGHKFCMSFSI